VFIQMKWIVCVFRCVKFSMQKVIPKQRSFSFVKCKSTVHNHNQMSSQFVLVLRSTINNRLFTFVMDHSSLDLILNKHILVDIMTQQRWPINWLSQFSISLTNKCLVSPVK
jgi:hypothetical protein